MTPVLSSSQLNAKLGHEIFFKAECLQKVGAFKARGAVNFFVHQKEKGTLPKQVVAFSSGNHAQAVTWAASLFGTSAEILMPAYVSKIKLRATEGYGARVTLWQSREETERIAKSMEKEGAILIPPYDDDQIICGQGTACLEALSQTPDDLNAVFAPCGGGGLLSGTLLAAKGVRPKLKVFGAEPLNSNDAAQSLRTGKIVCFSESPETIADGARARSVSERTFHYLKQLDGFYEITEDEILGWTQWISHYLKIRCEPTSALGMAGAARWLREQPQRKKVLVIVSGGNLDHETELKVWGQDRLSTLPR